jgi:Domain of unknown function (DUF4124)
MLRKNVIAFIMMLAVLAAGMAFASEIYKWTDEQGTVHYGDRPTGDASEERLDISSRPTDASSVQAQVQASYDARAAAKKAAASEPAGPSPEELQAQALERQEKCATYKARLQKFVTSHRLYKTDENGERVYLDADEIDAARERVANQVAEYCGS